MHPYKRKCHFGEIASKMTRPFGADHPKADEPEEVLCMRSRSLMASSFTRPVIVASRDELVNEAFRKARLAWLRLRSLP